MKEKVLALAGVWTSCQLISILSREGIKFSHQQERSFSLLLQSTLRFAAQNSEDLYGDASNLELGLLGLSGMFQHGTKLNNPVNRYFKQILMQQKAIAGNSQLCQQLGQDLDEIDQSNGLSLITPEHPVVESLATVYSNAMRLMPDNKRIRITGEKIFLTDPQIQNSIRALLLSAIRSTMFWRQQGGSWLELILKSQHYKNIAQQLGNSQ